MLVPIPAVLIFQDERLPFNKPGETKREDHQRFKPEDRMQWSQPRGDWQVWDKEKKGSQHKTGEHSDTTEQVDRVSLALSPRWVPLICSPMMRMKGNATPILPTPFLKKRYDRTKGCAFEVADISFLRLLGRGQLSSSHEQDTKTEVILRKAFLTKFSNGTRYWMRQAFSFAWIWVKFFKRVALVEMRVFTICGSKLSSPG